MTDRTLKPVAGLSRYIHEGRPQTLVAHYGIAEELPYGKYELYLRPAPTADEVRRVAAAVVDALREWENSEWQKGTEIEVAESAIREALALSADKKTVELGEKG